MLLFKIVGVLLLLYGLAVFALLRLETQMVFPAPQITRAQLQAQAAAQRAAAAEAASSGGEAGGGGAKGARPVRAKVRVDVAEDPASGGTAVIWVLFEFDDGRTEWRQFTDEVGSGGGATVWWWWYPENETN